VVVAQQDRLAVLHRADVLPLRHEEAAGETGKAHRVDPAGLQLLHVLEVLDAERGHREDLEGAAVGAAALMAGRRHDRLDRMAERGHDVRLFTLGSNVHSNRPDFVVDAVVLPSPYAFSFGGFVNLDTSLWLGAGGVFASAVDSLPKRQTDAPGDAAKLPSDMSGTSLFGGGLIAGDALAALGLGLIALAATVAGT